MEQDNLSKIYVNFGGLDTGAVPPNNGPRYSGGVNAQVANKRLSSFLCPSDRTNVWNNNVNLTMHNYALNAGNTSFYQVSVPVGCTGGNTIGSNGCVTYGGSPFGWYEDPLTLAAGGDSSPPNYTTGDANQGKSGRPRTMAEILDGTSNTLCVSEVITAPRGGNDIRGFVWWGGGAGFVTYQTPNNPAATDVMTGGGCGPTNIAGFPCTTTSTSTLPRMQLARSRHTGGVNAAMCDGSVRFFRNTVSLPTWRALGTAWGGEVLGNDF
jgi:prepilin-type processing-associated H-X9-DG protein